MKFPPRVALLAAVVLGFSFATAASAAFPDAPECSANVDGTVSCSSYDITADYNVAFVAQWVDLGNSQGDFPAGAYNTGDPINVTACGGSCTLSGFVEDFAAALGSECANTQSVVVAVAVANVGGTYTSFSSEVELPFPNCVGEGTGGVGEFTVSVLNPSDEEGVSQARINALGADAFYFTATTDVDRDEHPAESPDWELEVYETDMTTLICKMVASGNNTIDGIHYGQYFQHKVGGDPLPCDNFALGDYEARARADFGDGFGDWSAWSAFTVGVTDFDPELTCSDEASFLSFCWLTNIITFLLKPSAAAVNGVTDTLTAFNGKWPISWFSETAQVIADAYDVSPDELGTPSAGNPMAGSFPNTAWWASSLRANYGSWAGPAFSAFVWLGAIASVTRSGMAALGIPYDDPLDTNTG